MIWGSADLNFGRPERVRTRWRDLRTAARQEKSFWEILLEESEKSRSRDRGRGWVGWDAVWVKEQKPQELLVLLLLVVGGGAAAACFCSVLHLWLGIIRVSSPSSPFSLTVQLSSRCSGSTARAGEAVMDERVSLSLLLLLLLLLLLTAVVEMRRASFSASSLFCLSDFWWLRRATQTRDEVAYPPCAGRRDLSQQREAWHTNMETTV